MNRNYYLYILIVDGVKCSFALPYDNIIAVWNYNKEKYPEKEFTLERVQ